MLQCNGYPATDAFPGVDGQIKVVGYYGEKPDTVEIEVYGE